MRVALFVPCYVDQLYPDVGFAALELLSRFAGAVDVLSEPRCCGQIASNWGAVGAALPLARQFRDSVRGYDYVVCPSGSCTATLRRQEHWLEGEAGSGKGPELVELCQFLVQVLGISSVDVAFPHRVALHEGCHGLRELGLGSPSELGCTVPARDNPARRLLESVRELSLVSLARRDECCGFGGSFALSEPDVSLRMGADRVDDVVSAGAAIVTSADMSCLMHLEGIARRQRRRLGVLHVAQILAGRAAPCPEGAA